METITTRTKLIDAALKRYDETQTYILGDSDPYHNHDLAIWRRIDDHTVSTVAHIPADISVEYLEDFADEYISSLLDAI
mgnify:FL=1